MGGLLTGMSGAGKTTLVTELQQRGYAAHDADDGFSEAQSDGRWGWRADLVAELLCTAPPSPSVLGLLLRGAGQAPLRPRVLLTVPEPVLVERLGTRLGNSYGGDCPELGQVLTDRAEVEPLLLGSADLVLTTDAAPAQIADLLLRRIAEIDPSLP